ncbi:MAG: hypothetical protein ACOYXW_00930 [Actinomycetota bacterium]
MTDEDDAEGRLLRLELQGARPYRQWHVEHRVFLNTDRTVVFR